ncbi:hypothetical protein [Streptomyces chrestomyceticus]|uniref:Uncharacterized protein n=1 Tax=Streptomyces chrestomyceticus TaxID=68185 RepID=A0ABU7X6W9_9ACTN
MQGLAQQGDGGGRGCHGGVVSAACRVLEVFQEGDGGFEDAGMDGGTVRRAAREAVARPAAEVSPGWGMS